MKKSKDEIEALESEGKFYSNAIYVVQIEKDGRWADMYSGTYYAEVRDFAVRLRDNTVILTPTLGSGKLREVKNKIRMVVRPFTEREIDIVEKKKV